jgi:hypothetical protein
MSRKFHQSYSEFETSLAKPLLYPVAWTIPSLGIIASRFSRSIPLVDRYFTPIGLIFLLVFVSREKIFIFFRSHSVTFILLLLWAANNYHLATKPSRRKDDYRVGVL